MMKELPPIFPLFIMPELVSPHEEETSGDALRHLAFSIEDALASDRRGVSFARPVALDVRKYLFDLADRIDWDNSIS